MDKHSTGARRALGCYEGRLTGQPGLSSVGFEVSLGKVLISTARATWENRLLLSQDSINLLLLILLKKNDHILLTKLSRENPRGFFFFFFLWDGSTCSISERSTKGLKSFSLKFKFQQALTLPSPSFERLTGNHFIFQSRQNKLN